jgi:ATP-dependent Lon protease
LPDSPAPRSPSADAVNDHLRIVLAVRGTVLFPTRDSLTPLLVSREKSLAALEAAMMADRSVLVVTQREIETEDVEGDDLFTVGTLAAINRILRLPDGTTSVLVEGRTRMRVRQITQSTPHLIARAEAIDPHHDDSERARSIADSVLELFEQAVERSAELDKEAYVRALNAAAPGELADVVASSLELPYLQAQELLEMEQPIDRLRRVRSMLELELAVLAAQNKIHDRISDRVEDEQHERILRGQLQAIMDEIAETDAPSRDVRELRIRLESGRYPESIRARIEKDLIRLADMPTGSPEVNVLRNYIECLLDLPWQRYTRDRIDIARAQEILGRDHHGLDDVKERILEFLAVRKLTRSRRGPILCLEGPPGVGKSSLGRAIATAMGRKLVRVSLGGVRDEAEIRGHRRTYVGAMPGRIIASLRDAGSANPVFILDEIDKLGVDFRGDPATALLEALDPEQNSEFSDHYVEEPFDLSRVFFITTGNDISDLPAALVDRMEVVKIPGYTDAEKTVIARRHLLPRLLRQHGLETGQLTVSDGALDRIISTYTREAGVRELERQLAALCRSAAVRSVEGPAESTRVTLRNLARLLGRPRFEQQLQLSSNSVAAANTVFSNAWGGALAPVEINMARGAGKLSLTGQLDPILQESVQAARTYWRVHSADLGTSTEDFDKLDFHVHIPAGAQPKSGASAGMSICVAMHSALTGRPVRADTVLSGEITLQGRVLKTQDIKAKVLAIGRAGLGRFVLPAENCDDLEEVPSQLRKGIDFILVRSVEEVLAAALAH